MPKRILMHSLAYSNEGLISAMIAEQVCVISSQGEPNAEYARRIFVPIRYAG